MDDSKWLSLDEIRAFLAGAEPVEFAAQGRAEIYGWVERTLVRHEYARQGKAAKGLLRRYVEKLTGLSRAQAGESHRVPAAPVRRALHQD